jgi:CheY-like chemotaxis protein
MSILFVVDDNDLDHRILKLNLIRFPVFKHVLYFYEGLKLIKYLKENKNDSANLPDIILLDLNMPVCDGWNVLDAIALAYPGLSKKPVVYMVSASIMPSDINQALSYFFVKDFISKPITKDILKAISQGEKHSYR